jgi:hypothetical protein
VESITKKWLKFKHLQQMKEKQKQLKNAKLETNPATESVEFKGMVSLPSALLFLPSSLYSLFSLPY